MNQDLLFAQGEGDAWFRRNQASLEHWTAENDWPCRYVDLFGLQPKRIIEIGCANGYRLAALQEKFPGSECLGTDCSIAAITDGLRRYPGVRLYVAVANEAPIQEPADLVILHYVLHWIDRSRLFATLAEVDRLVASGGYLLLGDFDPGSPVKVPYQHRAGAWTYKQNYASIFTTTCLYRELGRWSHPHGGRIPGDCDSANRCFVSLLRKDSEQYQNRADGGIDPV